MPMKPLARHARHLRRLALALLPLALVACNDDDDDDTGAPVSCSVGIATPHSRSRTDAGTNSIMVRRHPIRVA